MKRVFSLTILAMGSVAAMLWWHPAVRAADDTQDNQPTAARAADRGFFNGYTLDVAIDATKFQFQRDTAVLPTNLIRGDVFITEGPIYPGGTIASGTTAFPPTTTVQPIGKWVCRGTFQIPSAQIAQGVTPFVYSTQYFLLNDGTSIVTEGPEGGAAFMRAITGGWNNAIGVQGDNLETPIGSNATGMFNVRFTFRIKG
jgi:hypothetical protein